MNSTKHLEKLGLIEWNKLTHSWESPISGVKLSNKDIAELDKEIKPARFPVPTQKRTKRKNRSFTNKQRNEELFNRCNENTICEILPNYKKLWKAFEKK